MEVSSLDRGRRSARVPVDENGESSLLLEVVRTKSTERGLSDDGKRDEIASVRSATVEVDGSEMERVGGSDRPGNEDSRTLTV